MLCSYILNNIFHRNNMAHYKLHFPQLLSIFLMTLCTPIYCGFTDSINTRDVDHMISSIRTPQIGDNTTLLTNTKTEQRQGFYPAGNQFSSALASMAHLGSFGNMASMGEQQNINDFFFHLTLLFKHFGIFYI